MPRTRGITIPDALVRPLRAACERQGHRLAARSPGRAVAVSDSGHRVEGLYAFAEAHGVDHSHLCRCLPLEGEPSRRLDRRTLAGVLASLPAGDRRELKAIAAVLATLDPTAPERFMRAMEAAEAGGPLVRRLGGPPATGGGRALPA